MQQQYAIRNPRQFEHYGECCWRITSSDGPGPSTVMVDGVERVFYDNIARGSPFGPDDGTLAPSRGPPWFRADEELMVGYSSHA